MTRGIIGVYIINELCFNHNPKLEYTRHYIQIKRYHLSDAIIKAMNNRCKKQIVV